MPDETKESNQAELLLYGEIFYQLLQRPWFKEIVETRVDIKKNIDHENKRIDVMVLEVPVEETMKRLGKIEKAKLKDVPQIHTPSAEEATKILKGK